MRNARSTPCNMPANAARLLLLFRTVQARPFADGAEIVLCAETSSPLYYPSIAPLLTIVEALLATVVAKGDGTELQSIQEFEANRKKSGHYTEQ